jgi:hypothetical protein
MGVSELWQKQIKLPLMLGAVVAYAKVKGYDITYGEGYDDDGKGHMAGSLHYIRLAQDLNLFKDGKYLGDGPEMEKGHNLLHDLWDKLGGAARIPGDLNHYSIAHGGKR